MKNPLTPAIDAPKMGDMAKQKAEQNVEPSEKPKPLLYVASWAGEGPLDPLRKSIVLINSETHVIIGEVKLSTKGQWGFRALGVNYVLSSQALREIADRIDTAGLAIAG